MLTVSLAGGCANDSRSADASTAAHSSATPHGATPSATAISPAPTAASDCGTASDPGNPDGGVVAGLDWPSGERALRTPAQAYLCLGSFAGAVVSLVQSGSPLAVRPARFTVPDGGGVLPVTVTATASGTTTLRLQIIEPAGKPQLLRTVARVVADTARWHFEHAD